MTQIDDARRKELLIALGNQPGVSAWFAVWYLFRRPAAGQPVVTKTKKGTDLCPTTAS